MSNIYEYTTKKKICSTEYMSDSLGLFDLRIVEGWHADLTKIDVLIKTAIEENIPSIEKNEGKLPKDLIVELVAMLPQSKLKPETVLANLEAFHGYRAYAFPDEGRLLKQLKNKGFDPYYGVAFADSLGFPHIHKKGPAFNLVLSGEGIFTGSEKDKDTFPNYYHGKKLVKGVELEIPANMTHGHLVKKGSPELFSFFFLQECGFRPEMRCQGDFEKVDNYDLKSFGDKYQ